MVEQVACFFGTMIKTCVTYRVCGHTWSDIKLFRILQIPNITAFLLGCFMNEAAWPGRSSATRHQWRTRGWDSSSSTSAQLWKRNATVPTNSFRDSLVQCHGSESKIQMFHPECVRIDGKRLKLRPFPGRRLIRGEPIRVFTILKFIENGVSIYNELLK